MKAAEKRKIYRECLCEYGEELQLMLAIEEMSELMKEISKYVRSNGNNVKELREELADAFNMLNQLKYLFFTIEEEDAELERLMDAKLNRVMERIESDRTKKKIDEAVKAVGEQMRKDREQSKCEGII
jgi:NTP pyrophosphatase (non-canonical NTP hydrolase)